MQTILLAIIGVYLAVGLVFALYDLLFDSHIINGERVHVGRVPIKQVVIGMFISLVAWPLIMWAMLAGD